MASISSSGKSIPKTAIRFRPAYLDFRRGICVGNLEDNARITRILKLELEDRYGEPFVTERYGRGVYWKWIGYLPRANRVAKPLSSEVSFGCSKFFLMVDTAEKIFKCGLQVERGYVKASGVSRQFELRSDWDWHRLIKSLRPKSPMDVQINRLIRREGFWIQAGTWSNPVCFSRSNWVGVGKLRNLLTKTAPTEWSSLQIYYPMNEDEVRTSTGVDLVEAMLAVFHEVTPAMNICMQTQLRERV